MNATVQIKRWRGDRCSELAGSGTANTDRVKALSNNLLCTRDGESLGNERCEPRNGNRAPCNGRFIR